MNIILIVADDMRADMIDGLPSLARWGPRWPNGFVSNPVCCASRVSILTGNHSATTGVWGNLPPDGGYTAFDPSRTIATALNDEGWTTALIGKYLNGYDEPNYAEVPPGWDRWWGILSRGDQYYGYGVSIDGEFRLYGREPHEYLTDVIAREVEAFLVDTPEPFFAMITPSAPHKHAYPAPRHRGSYADLAPHTPESLNEADVSDKPAWVQAQPLLHDGRIRSQRSFRRHQYQTLLAVNDLIEGVLTTLRNRRVLDETAIFFCSDNGYLYGEHRLIAKGYPYLEATRMPFAVRWPGGLPDANRTALVQNIDLAPTFADIAGVSFDCDGVSLLEIFGGAPGRSDVLIAHGAQDLAPAWASVQRRTQTYTRYSNGEEETYDLVVDPLQLHSLPATDELRATLDMKEG